MKYLGMLLVIASCAAAGWLLSARMRRRVMELEGYVSFIGYAADSVRYTLTPVEEILEEGFTYSTYAQLPLIAGCSRRMREEKDFARVWQAAIGSDRGTLNAQDTAVLYPLGEVLGGSDAKTQHAALQRIGSALQKRCEEARADTRKYASLYSRLGLLLGIGVAIVLL